jgi:A/G-specific adenine glycosylase
MFYEQPFTFNAKEWSEFRHALAEWFERAGRQLPWRETFDPYRILVSELMLQQTQVATVRAYYLAWLARFPSLQELARAEESEVLRAWEGLGYYNRARNLHRCAKVIVNEMNDHFPSELEALLRLPGIGRYTAGALRSFAFNLPAPIVDGNIARVLSRILNLDLPIDGARGKQIIWEAAEVYARTDNPRLLNGALMELGALICIPRKPLCMICPVRSFCRATDPETLPRKKMRPPSEGRTETYFWAVREGSVLLAQNREKRWKGLWSLPKLKKSDGREPVVILVHPITRFIIRLEVYQMEPPLIVEPDQEWHPLDSLEKLPMPAPHRRAVRKLTDPESV